MIRHAAWFCLLPLIAVLAADPAPQPPSASPAELGFDPGRLAELNAVMSEAIAARQTPGAVIVVVRKGKIAFRQAYGRRAVEPASVPMTADTIFDLASLTKPIATATAIMVLKQRGKLGLEDRVSSRLPGFDRHGKGDITIEHLLLHTSGLIADNSLGDYAEGPEQAWERICDLKLQARPGERFVYSDVGYIVLGKLVEKVSGRPLEVFAREEIFQPLGMTETGFLPSEGQRARCAPTEKVDGTFLQGVVHDPRARKLGGVAGHAGLFSTGDDLARYVTMFLRNGMNREPSVLNAGTLAEMIRPRPVPGGRRALGWDVETAYSGNRGDRFPAGSFGHTGFTGTSIWIDPGSETAVIFLSNRVHPDGKGNVNRLRGKVSSIVAGALEPPLPLREPSR
jgi:CubicO group peptidase (beta-lactamase class C family)